MADETTANQVEETNPDVAEEAAGKPGLTGKKKWLIIGIVFAVQLPVVILIGQKLIRPHLVPQTEQAAMEKSDETRGTILMLEDVTVNLKGSRKSRFLRVSIGLEVEDDKLISEIEMRKPEIRDAVITSISGRRVDQLISVEGKEQLKAELKQRIDGTLQEGNVLKVYFSDFVVQ
jgi:flagellar basal body-associated protein FliL